MSALSEPSLAREGALEGSGEIQSDEPGFLPDPVFEPPESEPGLAGPLKDLRTLGGIGGEWAYGDAGTAEVGGFFSFSTTFAETALSAEPMIGFFVLDHLEIGLLGQLRYTRARGGTSARFGMAVEPSAHVPLAPGLLWVGGVALGGAVGAVVDENDAHAALVAAPRLGVQVLMGRSGLLGIGVRYQALFPDEDGRPVFGQPELTFANTMDVIAGYSLVL